MVFTFRVSLKQDQNVFEQFSQFDTDVQPLVFLLKKKEQNLFCDYLGYMIASFYKRRCN